MNDLQDIECQKVLQVIADKAIRHIYIDGAGLGSPIFFDLLNKIKQFGAYDMLNIVMHEFDHKAISHPLIYIKFNDDKSDIITNVFNLEIGFKLKKYSFNELKQQQSGIMYEVFIKFDEIIRITSSDRKNNVCFITTTGSYEKRVTMKELLDKLPQQFIQVEKRDIINLNFLQGINSGKNIIFMKNRDALDMVSVGKNYKEGT